MRYAVYELCLKPLHAFHAANLLEDKSLAPPTALGVHDVRSRHESVLVAGSDVRLDFDRLRSAGTYATDALLEEVPNLMF